MGLFSKPKKKGIIGAVSKAYSDAKKQVAKEQKAAERAQAAAQREAIMAMYPYREIGQKVTTGEVFPLGVKGCTEIRTIYKNGKDVVCYALDDPATQKNLRETIAEVNGLLDETSRLTGHEFGTITNIMGTPGDELWGYARIEYAPVTKSGSVNKTPVKLLIETSAALCSPGSYSGFVKYDMDGNMKQVEITEWKSNRECFKMKATRVRGEMKIKEATSSRFDTQSVLYVSK